MKFLISILFVILGMVILQGCSNEKPKQWQLENGEIVSCVGDYSDCGYYLNKCSNGAIYHCEKNIKELPQ